MFNLKDKELLETETEIRILVGGGLGYPRWFILNDQNGKLISFYVRPISENEKVKMEKMELSNPKSSWENFQNFLLEKGIKFPLELSVDKDEIPIYDGENIIVEAKSGNNYNEVYYSDLSYSTDGKKVIDVCLRIKEEFNIDLVSPSKLKLRNQQNK